MDRTLVLNERISIPYEALAIGLVWLFHFSSIVGIAIGFESWFISKTPLHLLTMALLLSLVFPIDTRTKAMAFAGFFAAGMLVEWTGVHTGLLFGTYEYGINLGPRIDGIPWLIGVNWAMLTFITACMAGSLVKTTLARATLGASFMVFLDLFIEVAAPRLDYWAFDGSHAPIQNYTMWFLTAFVLQWIYQRMKIKGNVRFSYHLYAAQLIFFLYLYGIQTF